MESYLENVTEENKSSVSYNYSIFESLKYPVCVIGIDGIISYGNEAFHEFSETGGNDIRLNWKHPLFPEYRKRVAQAYLGAKNGTEKQCFAIINSPDGTQMTVEIYLFPMFEQKTVSSILALLKIVDNRLLSFDRSTLSLISEDNFKYENLHFEFSPIPVLRISEEREIIKCSHSFEGFIGYTSKEILEKKSATFKSIFTNDSDRVKRTVSDIITGDLPFKRIGEVKISTKENEVKVANLTLYPIIQNNKISAIEIILEDITKIIELKDKINAMNRVQLLSDLTKGFLHSISNNINVIMSKTQLLSQITEKVSVIDGIQIIQNSALEMVDQIRRVQNFISDKSNINDEKTEPLADIIEDAIEFSRMQFKIEDKENRRSINIERKYFTGVNIKSDTILLREIIISIILKVSAYIQKKGTLQITLIENKNLYLTIKVNKDIQIGTLASLPGTINIFSGVDIRQVAEKIHLKIIEEESAQSYAIKAIFPPRIIINKQKKESKDIEYKLRDLDIIIVEDEKVLQKILYELFDRMGNRVFICENGDEALSEFKKKHYDLVITDYGITGIHGIELSARVKEINENTVTALLSGWMLSDLKAYKNVVDLYLPKPFKLEELINNIAKIFTEKKLKTGIHE